MDSQRRFVLSLLAASASLPWLGGCQPTPPLNVASHVWPGYEFMFLARDQGWFNKQQVQLVETATASDSLRALSEQQVSAADDIELVEIDANDCSAWKNQSLDVMQTYEPTATRIRNTGAHLLYSS